MEDKLIKKILVLVNYPFLPDFTTDYLVQFNKLIGAEIILFHAVVVEGPRAILHKGSIEKAMIQNFEQNLIDLVAFVKSKVNHDIKVSYRILPGSSVEEEVLKLTQAESINLIITGKKKISWLSSFFKSSNTTAIVKTGLVPVLTVPEPIL